MCDQFIFDVLNISVFLPVLNDLRGVLQISVILYVYLKFYDDLIFCIFVYFFNGVSNVKMLTC